MDEMFEKLSEMEGRKYSLSLSDKSYIKKAYLQIVGREMQKTCDNSYRDALIITIVQLRKQKKAIMENKKPCVYSLKNGVGPLQTPYIPTAISNSNITDELAEAYLKLFPSKIALFATYPADWEDRIKKEKKEQSKRGKKPAKKAESSKEKENKTEEVNPESNKTEEKIEE